MKSNGNYIQCFFNYFEQCILSLLMGMMSLNRRVRIKIDLISLE